MFACTLAFLLPACDPPEDTDTSIGGPGDFSDAPDGPDGDTDPRPKPQRLDRLSDAPRGGDAPSPEDLVDEPHDLEGAVSRAARSADIR
jgi:hypothetical protein